MFIHEGLIGVTEPPQARSFESSFQQVRALVGKVTFQEGKQTEPRADLQPQQQNEKSSEEEVPLVGCHR